MARLRKLWKAAACAVAVSVAVAAALAPAGCGGTPCEPVTTVILVRHAEKAAGGPDPALDAAGRARAEELSRILEGAGVSAVYTSQFLRTRETVEPLARRLGLTPTVAEVEDAERSSAELARRVLAEHRGQVVLVSGHSNTVPRIIESLGVAEAPEIPESRYEDLFVVVVTGDNPRLLALEYGARTGASPSE